MKTVRITEELFTRIYSYFFLGKQDPTNIDVICEQLQDKMDRLLARQDYTDNINKLKKKTGA